MKKLSFYIIAVQIILVVYFILPSFCVKSNTLSLQYTLSELIVFSLLIVFCLYFTKSFSSLKSKNLPPLEYIKLVLIAVCAIVVPQFAAKTFFPQFYRLPLIIVPETNFEKIVQFISIIVAAVFEEILYRVFLPESVLYLINCANIKKPETEKFIKLAAEFSVAVLFAVQHMYMGAAGVVTAFTAGLSFRWITVATGSPLLSILIHCANNLLTLLLQ